MFIWLFMNFEFDGSQSFFSAPMKTLCRDHAGGNKKLVDALGPKLVVVGEERAEAVNKKVVDGEELKVRFFISIYSIIQDDQNKSGVILHPLKSVFFVQIQNPLGFSKYSLGDDVKISDW